MGGAAAVVAADVPLYPLLFAPILQYRLWGGRRLAKLLGAAADVEGPIGEAWMLSDRHDHQSRVVAGQLAGRTLGELLEEYPDAMLGRLAGRLRVQDPALIMWRNSSFLFWKCPAHHPRRGKVLQANTGHGDGR